MNRYISNSELTDIYLKWIDLNSFVLNKLINFKEFKNYINHELSNENYKNIDNSINWWRRDAYNFIKVKRNFYIDPLFQPDIYSNYINQINLYEDKNILSSLRINDSVIVKRIGKRITNFNYENEGTYEKKLSKETKELFQIYYSLNYFNSWKAIKPNYNKFINKYDIEVLKIKNKDDFKEAINEKINFIFKTKNNINYSNLEGAWWKTIT